MFRFGGRAQKHASQKYAPPVPNKHDEAKALEHAAELPEGEWEAPTEEEALINRDENHPHDLDGYPVPISASNVKVGTALGDGFSLYFLQLKWLVALCLLMFACNVPWMVVCKFGEMYTPYNGTVDLYRKGDEPASWNLDDGTFAAIEPLYVNHSNYEADIAAKRFFLLEVPRLGTYRVDRSDLLYSIMASDMLASILFLVALALMGWKAKSLLKEVDDNCLEAADYSVYVKGLPEDINDVEEVHSFFELKFGKVVDVYLARNDGTLLQMYERLAKTKERVLEEQARYLKTRKNEKSVIRYQRRAAKIEHRLKELEARSVYRTVGAFITFSRNSSKIEAMNKVPSNWLAKLMQPSEDKFRGIHSYYITRAPPPSNVLYENLEVRKSHRVIIGVAVNILLVTPLLIASFAALNELTRLKLEAEGVKSLVVPNQIVQPAVIVPVLPPPPALLPPPPLTASSVDDASGTTKPSITTTTAIATATTTTTTTTTTTSLSTSTTTSASSALRRSQHHQRRRMSEADKSVAYKPLEDGVCNAFMASTCNAAVTDGNRGYFIDFTYGVLLTKDTGFNSVENSPYDVNDAVSEMRTCFNGLNGTTLGHRCLDLSNCYKCYCYGLRNFTTWKAFERFESATTAGLVVRDCGSFIAKSSESWEVYAGTAGIAVQNAILNQVLGMTAKLERHVSEGATATSHMLKLYTATLVNTAFLSLLINANVPSLRKFIEDIDLIKDSLLFRGTHRDFNDGWYNEEGMGIILLILITTFAPLGGYIGNWYRKAFVRWWKKRRVCSQQKLNELFIGPDFQLAESYARLTLNLTLILMYGSGMPVVYLVGAICFFAQQSIDRFMVFRVCRMMPRLSKEVGTAAMEIYPWLMCLHLAFGAWMHSHFYTERIDEKAQALGVDTSFFSNAINNTIASAGASTSIIKVVDSIGSKIGVENMNASASMAINATAVNAAIGRSLTSEADSDVDVIGRLMQTNAFPLFLMLCLILIIVPVIRYVVFGFLGPILFVLLCPCLVRGKNRPDELEALPNYEDAFFE